MRVAYLLKAFPVVSQTFVASEIAALRRRGVKVRVLRLEGSPDRFQHRFVGRAGLEEVVVDGRERFLPALEEFRPDLLHAHFATEATEVALSLAEELGLPFTFTAHGYDIRDLPSADFAQRAAGAAAVVTVCEANARAIRGFGVPTERLQIVPSGVDLARFAHTIRTPGLIVCVARHRAVKDLGMLIEACALLRARGVRFRCVLIGDGPRRGQIEWTCGRLGLGGIVELSGALDHDEVLARWRRASIAVLTSVAEGLPVCLLEAAASGVPAVATRVGGIPELVEHGATGLLVSPGDHVALADALQRLLENSREATAMGRAAQARVRARFSVEHQVDGLLRVWRTACSGRSRRISTRRDTPPGSRTTGSFAAG